MRMREVLRVGATVASIGALALKVADTPTQRKNIFRSFCRYPTLCVWGKHSAWQSTAEIGGGSPRAVAATVPRHFRAEARTHFVLQRNVYESEGD